MKKIATLLAVMFLAAPQARAAGGISSAGPRFGLVYQTNRDTWKQLKEYRKSQDPANKTSPVLSAFGWQFEYEYLNTGGGITGLLEFVPLVLGLESGFATPSINTLVGVRFSNGIELGFGPNISSGAVESVKEDGTREYRAKTGVGMGAAVGLTLSAGEMDFPINLAAIGSNGGWTTALMVGWTIRGKPAAPDTGTREYPGMF